MNRLMADALINFGNFPSYHNKWIADYDWLEIIKIAYYATPPTRKLDIMILNRAVSRNEKFELATSESQPNSISIFEDTISHRFLSNGVLNDPF
jgi:hypothetical protein